MSGWPLTPRWAKRQPGQRGASLCLPDLSHSPGYCFSLSSSGPPRLLCSFFPEKTKRMWHELLFPVSLGKNPPSSSGEPWLCQVPVTLLCAVSSFPFILRLSFCPVLSPWFTEHPCAFETMSYPPSVFNHGFYQEYFTLSLAPPLYPASGKPSDRPGGTIHRFLGPFLTFSLTLPAHSKCSPSFRTSG